MTTRRPTVTLELLRDSLRENDSGRLSTLMAAGVTALVDRARPIPPDLATVHGVEAVCRSLLGALGPAEAPTGAVNSVNGSPGLLFRRDGAVVGVLTATVDGGLITALWLVLSPDKLRNWNR